MMSGVMPNSVNENSPVINGMINENIAMSGTESPSP